MKHFQHVTNFVLDHPWALTQPYREVIAGVLARRIAGLGGDPEAIQQAAAKRDQLPQPRRGGTVAVLPLHGVIMPRADLMFDYSGGVSLESLAQQMDALVADNSIRTIVWSVDSPGGTVAGCTEFVAKTLAWRAQKPIIAVANFTMASAAYWISAAATEVVASPSAYVGSVGVYTIHDDLTKALEQLGIKREYIFAGKHKVDGNEAEPLSKAARAELQAMVDQSMASFTADVAKGRGAPVGEVRGGYGEGRCVRADEALTLGLVDRVGTLDETIARLTPTAVSLAAATDAPALHAADAVWQNDTYRALQELTL